MQFSSLMFVSLAGCAAAICPGFNYGIGNMRPGPLGNDWNVYDDSCNVVDGLLTTENPCDSGVFGCTPDPITFNSYKNSFSGLV